MVRRVADLLNTDVELVWSPGNNHLFVKAHSLFCYWLVSDLGMRMSHLTRQLGLSVSAISQFVVRGKRIFAEDKFSLDDVKF